MVRKAVKFSVTQEDIDSGDVRSPVSCPVARCVSRTLGVPALLDTDADDRGPYLWIDYESNTDNVWSIPVSVAEFVKTYDASGAGSVAPFEFVLGSVEQPDTVLLEGEEAWKVQYLNREWVDTERGPMSRKDAEDQALFANSMFHDFGHSGPSPHQYRAVKADGS